MTRNGFAALAVTLLVLGLLVVNELQGFTLPERVTTSIHISLDTGTNSSDVTPRVLPCKQGHRFLVEAVSIGPEITAGTTANDVVQLPRWAASVALVQHFVHGAEPVPLTLFGNGPEHISAELPQGQAIDAPGDELPVRIALLGGKTATARFEFNVHVTGRCGIPFVLPKGE